MKNLFGRSGWLLPRPLDGGPAVFLAKRADEAKTVGVGRKQAEAEKSWGIADATLFRARGQSEHFFGVLVALRQRDAHRGRLARALRQTHLIEHRAGGVTFGKGMERTERVAASLSVLQHLADLIMLLLQ